VKILVAKTNLDHGAALKNPQDMFVYKEVVQDEDNKTALTEMKVIKGKYLKHSLRKGTHITQEDLMDEKTSILANLPDGYVAYGIRVNAESIAGGFASLPGSKVNLLWTVRKGDDVKNSFSRILLEDVLVLAADTNTVRDHEGKAMPAQVVTVALKSLDSMKVKLAETYGALSMTLRKFGDKTPSPDKELFNDKDLFASELERANGKSPTKDKLIDPDGDALQNVPAVKAVEKAVEEVQPAPKAQPAPKRYFHVVNHRDGDKWWKQTIEVDAQGNPLPDAVLSPPGVEAQPDPQTQSRQQPAGDKDSEKVAKKKV
jgi:Flp pilus assembly protein CpaB